MVRTTDGGATWSSPINSQAGFLHAVSFADANTGIVTGTTSGSPLQPPEQIFLRTTDGGATWTSQNSGVASALSGVSFADTSTGMAVGSVGALLRTTDGGATWTNQTRTVTTLSLIDVFFVDANTGIIVGSGRNGGSIQRTTDGGATW